MGIEKIIPARWRTEKGGSPSIPMFDAEYPPAKTPAGAEVVMGYLDGGDASHGWTRSEWLQFPGLWKIPVFVRSNPGQASAEADAYTCLQLMHDLDIPKDTAVVLDLEQAIDPKYVTEFADIVCGDGYKVWPYGSESTIYDNPHCNGWGVAHWTGLVHEEHHDWVVFTQYEDAGPEDLDQIHRWQVHHHLSKDWPPKPS